jgi:ABC-type branched-subunit amino acid transport system ATPase component
LAPSFVDIIVDWISTLVAEQGTGVLWVVEQNPAPILEVSSRTYVLEGGQINAEMPSAALLDSGRLERAILEEREILEEGAGREVDVAAMDE